MQSRKTKNNHVFVHVNLLSIKYKRNWILFFMSLLGKGIIIHAYKQKKRNMHMIQLIYNKR